MGVVLWTGGALWAAVKGRALLAFGLSLALFSILPYFVIPSIPLVEYKAYPFLIGSALVLASIAAGLKGQTCRKVCLGLFLLLLIASAVETYKQARTWRSRVSVWQQALRVYPDNPTPRVNLASFAMHAGREEEASAHLSEAIKSMQRVLKRSGVPIHARWAWGLYTLGRMKQRNGYNGIAKFCYLYSLKFDPEYRPSLFYLAKVLGEEGRRNEGRRYLQQFRALVRDPYEQRKLQELEPLYR
jgi:tetratricopeptide (TPR) repeat protein